jgi:hypothetical protein
MATVAVAAATMVSWLAVPARAAADDQADADVAVAEFTDRAVEAGWVSSGPSEGTGEDDELFAECGLEATFFDALSGSAPGVTASAQSDELTFTTDGVPATTELFGSTDQEFLSAVVITVDAEHVDDIVSFVDAVGSDEFAECYAQLGMGETSPEDTAFVDEAFETSVDSAPDLGVGDDSGGLNLTFSGDLFGEQFDFQASLLFARVDRTLIGLVWGYQGDNKPTSGLDPVEELAALAESFAG